MGQKLIVKPIDKGIKTDRLAFNIDNDSFPFLINAYQWRGRVKRKRGTRDLTRLQRYIGTTTGAGNLTVTILPIPIATGISSFTIGSDVFVDPGGASPVTLISNSSGTGVLDRTTGILTITGSIALTDVIYFPGLPVMGLEDLILTTTQFPGTLGFDTDYSYNIPTTYPYTAYDVSFYKNPAVDAINLPNYVAKGTQTATSWNGKDYQQFWTTNYQGAFWATNGVDVNFTGSTIGMQFAPASTITFVGMNPNTLIVTISNCPLIIGDFVFLNEWLPVNTLNFQSGYVINCVPNTPAPALKTVTIKFPNANFTVAAQTPGIIQYLTNRSDTSKDCLRWYDGDPTVVNSPNGWVNFAPPLSQFSFSIADLPAAQYYLVCARIILPFKDRLLFFGPVVQTSTGTPIYLQDTIIYSQNGTPYYTSSFTGSVLAPTTGPIQSGFEPILVPNQQTSTANAYFCDQTGFGGFLTAGIAQPIISASANEDVIIVGFNLPQARLVYTGNDIVPFNLYIINSELGSGSTFSTINMDQGVVTKGNRGIVITAQTNSQRIDLDIPDQVFEMKLTENGNERFTAQRDFLNEWIYFTYPSNEFDSKFPTQTLLWNYRDNSWGMFNESYTTYGQFRVSTGRSWLTIGRPWNLWTDPWISGSSTAEQPDVIAGNQQGFVVFREDDVTDETESLYIQNISGNTVTSPNHCLNLGDYIIISGSLGSIASSVNDIIFSVSNPTTNTFVLSGPVVSGTYQGGGLIKRMYIPQILTKQFPVAWDMSRKTKIGPQQYLLTKTDNAQIQLLIFLSQNDDFPSNVSQLQPNDSLIYSTVLYTCPESTNLGLTPANTNLLQFTNIDSSGTSSSSQSEIWHRMNTSLIGDTVQVGFTLSNDQMTTLDSDGNFVSQFAEIELHAMILDVSPSQNLA